MTATLNTPATTTSYTLCYCDDDQHRQDDREQTWRLDIEAVKVNMIHYCPGSHIVRRVSHIETVAP